MTANGLRLFVCWLAFIALAVVMGLLAISDADKSKWWACAFDVLCLIGDLWSAGQYKRQLESLA